MTWSNLFGVHSKEKSSGEMRVLYDGGQVTDAEYLAEKPEFQDHLRAVSDTIESFLRNEDNSYSSANGNNANGGRNR